MTRIAVVGGGLAGLAAAVAAADAGAEVTLLEARPRLGGGTWSFRSHGLWFDNGQHVFLRCCTEYLAFLDRLGVSDQVHLQPRLDIPVLGAGGRVGRLRRTRGLPAPLHLGPALARYRHLSPRQRLGLAPAVATLRRVDPSDPAADETSFGEWLAARGQSPAVVERLWDLITRPTVNLPAGEASLAMAAMVFRTGLLESAPAADIGWSRVPLGRLHADAAVRVLAGAGARVELGRPVTSVRVDPSGVSLAGGWGSLEADAAVVAVPHDQAAGLLPPGTVRGQDELGGLGASPIVNVNLVYDRVVCPWAVFAAVDSPVQWVFDHSEAAGLEPGAGQALTVSLSAADAYLGLASPVLVDTVQEELGRLLPGVAASGARVVATMVTREGRATFRAGPGSGRLRPGAATTHPRLAVAGAWTATGWPATMEGAVRSGRAAAAHLLGDGRRFSAGPGPASPTTGFRAAEVST